MTALLRWFKTHSISSHTLAGMWMAGTALWAADPAFKNYVWGIYHALPRSVHEFISGVAIPVLLYWQARKRLQASPQPVGK